MPSDYTRVTNAVAHYTPGSADDYPTVGVAATATVVGGVVVGASVAVGGTGPRAYSVPEAEQLVRHPPAGAAEVAAEVADAAAGRAAPVDDRLGSAAYKRAMVTVWVRRALDACLDVPPGGFTASPSA